MGVVYRALDLKLDREVALKVLPPDLVADAERKRRFVLEAKAAAKLEHPHIGVVHEIDEADGITFISMELIRGEQLRDVLTQGPLPPRRALDIATEVAEGLAKAHEEGIVHRDLKPANIMVTEDGHTKIIDFGLAKLIEPFSSESSDVETVTRGGTDPGKVMGTVSYMSPEQARGQAIDHRSDIFTFGILLHEMLTGHLPFKSDSGVETLNAILKDPAPRLASAGLDMEDEAGFKLQSLLDKCLAKQPTERYQTIKDVLSDLRAVKRQLESGPTKSSQGRSSRRPWVWAVGGGILAALAVIAFLSQRPSQDSEDATHSTVSKPSIAVLFFDNMSKDPELDWLRVGLADMLSTDLAQSTDIRVLTTDRLYQILEEIDRLDVPITSAALVKEVAEEGEVENILLGSFMKAGDQLRVSVRLQEVQSGEVLASERVEGVGESSIFEMADELTNRVRSKLEIPREAPNRSIEELTTSSPVAYRLFIEGGALQSKELYAEAIALLEKAVETDPDFAEAHHRLALIHWNLGHDTQAEQHARLALAQADRLSDRIRYRLEARVNSFREVDFARAIQAYKNVVEMGDGPNNLAFRYLLLERCEEAIALLEDYKTASRGNFRTMAPYTNLGACYNAMGNYEKARRLYQEMLERFPKNVPCYQYFGALYTYWDRLDNAMEAFEEIETSLPGYPRAQLGRWWVAVLQGDWERAEVEARDLAESKDERWQWQGQMNLAILELYRGQAQNALALLARAADLYHEPSLFTGWARSMAGHVFLQKHQLVDAVKVAKLAQHDGKGNPPEWEGLFLESVSLAKQGSFEKAEQKAEELLRRTESIPTEKEKRRRLHLIGEINLARHQPATAIEKLEQALTMLPPRGRSGYIHASRIGPPAHAPIWYSLASAYLDASDEESASKWYRRIIDCGVERVEWPILYIRSFYFLGKIHESRGDTDEARECYRRFYEYWKDGDIDRERVKEAKSKIDMM
jgi:serine/threonine protein kinase/tetratricopeptide (TPR) repeat protein